MPKVDLSPLQIATKLAKLTENSQAGPNMEANSTTESKVVDIVPYKNEPQSASSGGGSVPRSPFMAQNEAGVTSSGVYTTRPEANPSDQGSKQKRGDKKEVEFEKIEAPEKHLTIFAMRLAVLEKIASGAGTLAFIWATVVILGGYAVTMKEKDFWFVSVILFTEGTRIFSRSHELEWQQQAGGKTSFMVRVRLASSNAYQRGSDAIRKGSETIRTAFSTLINPREDRLANTVLGSRHMDSEKRDTSAQLSRTWSSSQVPMLPYLNWTFQAKNVSRVLYWLQLGSAITSISLSVLRLCQQQYTREGEGETEKNHTSALNVFYSLAVVEAMIFLIERAYWEWKISRKMILLKVTKMCGLRNDSLCTIRIFFYEVYSKCLSESVFEGLKMDLVRHSVALLQSDVPDEQLGGLRVLVQFASKEEYADNTMRRIGTTQGVAERLIEMVTWKNPNEYEIRRLAAELLCKLVKYNRNCVRIAGMSGSIDSISTLLEREGENGEKNWPIQYYRNSIESEAIASHEIDFHIVGLRILKNLAKDHANCVKIGSKKRLLSRLVTYIDIDTSTLRSRRGEFDNHIKIVKKALQLFDRLSRTPGHSGTILREEISKIVFTVTNLRKIIEYGEKHVTLQQHAINILYSLALDNEVREVVGRTGGIIRNLFLLFLKESISGNENELHLAKTAGETLTLLSLQSNKNCLRMLRLRLKVGYSGTDIVEGLINKMEDWELGHLAMRILRSFCTYVDFADKMRIVTCTSRVLKLMIQQSGKLQEAAMGLAARTTQFMGNHDFASLFPQEFTKLDLVKKLREVLEHYPSPSAILPRVRRFALELIVSLVDKDASLLQEFQSQNFETLLVRVLDTHSDVENFATFSGSVGVTRHRKSMEELVELAITKLQQDEKVSDHDSMDL